MNAVIFDMDGTLIDSSHAISVTINTKRADLSLKALPKDEIMSVVNDPNKNAFAQLFENKILNSDEKISLEEDFRNNYSLYARAYDGIYELLEKCKSAGFVMAVASNAPTQMLKEILIKSKIDIFFDQIIGVSKSVKPKPDPDMLLLAIKNLGAKRAVFVGDSKKDQMAAKNANIKYLQACWGDSSSDDLADFNAIKPIEVFDFVTKIF